MIQNLCCVGACYLDTILTVPHFPAEDSKLRASTIARRRGGNCPNSLEVLRGILVNDDEANLELSLISTLPSRNSHGAEEIAKSLGPEIDLSRCIYREQHSEAASSYIIRSLDTSSRTIVNFNELPEMMAAEFRDAVKGLDLQTAWFHFEGRIPAVILQSIQDLKQRCPEMTISVEVEKPGRDGLAELAAEANVVFFSKTWAQGQGYSTPETFLRAQIEQYPKAEKLFVTWGDAGAAAIGSDETFAQCAATKVANVVDTVGAGDTFTAGALYGLIIQDTWTLDQALQYANALAGRKIQQEGFDLS